MPLHNWDKIGSKYGLLKLFKKFLNRLFAEMFLDSEIAKNFQCGSTKVSFVTVCILAPFLHSFLLQKISSSPQQVVSFDEFLNNSVQKRPMDSLICYFGKDMDRVCTCYVESEFMARSTAVDVLEIFQDRIFEIDESKVMQVSFDGPNVNLTILKEYITMVEEK